MKKYSIIYADPPWAYRTYSKKGQVRHMQQRTLRRKRTLTQETLLISGMFIADNIHSALFSVAAYTFILCFSLFKTGSLAKSIFHAH